jgi:hypothetical protein
MRLIEITRSERDEARETAQDLLEKNAKQAVNLVRWRECAERLAAFVVPVTADMADHTAGAAALAEFERLKEASK